LPIVRVKIGKLTHLHSKTAKMITIYIQTRQGVVDFVERQEMMRYQGVGPSGFGMSFLRIHFVVDWDYSPYQPSIHHILSRAAVSFPDSFLMYNPMNSSGGNRIRHPSLNFCKLVSIMYISLLVLQHLLNMSATSKSLVSISTSTSTLFSSFLIRDS